MVERANTPSPTPDDGPENPLRSTKFVFRELLEEVIGTEPERAKQLWDRVGRHQDASANGLLDYASKVDLTSKEDVEAASAGLLAAAIAAHDRGDLKTQIQLSRILEMIAAQTPHTEAQDMLLAGLNTFPLLFDTSLCMMTRNQVDIMTSEDGTHDLLCYLQLETGSKGLEFVDEFLTRDSKEGIVVHTVAVQPDETDETGWQASVAPFYTSAYKTTFLKPDDPNWTPVVHLLPVVPTDRREVFTGNRMFVRAAHQDMVEIFREHKDGDIMKEVALRLAS